MHPILFLKYGCDTYLIYLLILYVVLIISMHRTTTITFFSHVPPRGQDCLGVVTSRMVWTTVSGPRG